VIRSAFSARQQDCGRCIWLLLVAAGVLIPACSSDAKPDDPPACPGVTQAKCPDTVPSYASDVAPIIEAKCQHCHAVDNTQGLWSLSDQEGVNEWSDTILRQIRACAQPPPDSGYALTLDERNALEAWLVCGAPDN
jgi:uncharacterized membrane protein